MPVGGGRRPGVSPGFSGFPVLTKGRQSPAVAAGEQDNLSVGVDRYGRQSRTLRPWDAANKRASICSGGRAARALRRAASVPAPDRS